MAQIYARHQPAFHLVVFIGHDHIGRKVTAQIAQKRKGLPKQTLINPFFERSTLYHLDFKFVPI
jgi:hypothetical protein